MQKLRYPVFIIILFIVGSLIREYKIFIPYRSGTLSSKSAQIASLKKKNFYFKDQTQIMGLNYSYLPPEIDPVAYYRVDSLVQAPGIAVGDVNNDGFQDFLVVSSVKHLPSHLYLNQQGKKFSEVAIDWGISQLSKEGFSAIMPGFFDYDNDGKVDLYVVGLGCSRIFHNEGHKFIEVMDSQATDCKNAQAFSFFDYDSDGYLDIYVLRYWRDYDLHHLSSSQIYVNNLHNATNGGKNSLYRNLGNGTFEDVSKEVGAEDTHWTYDSTFADLNDDGNFELYLSNDYGADSIYRLKDKKFENISKVFEFPDRRYSMNTSLVDIGNIKPSLYVSNLFEGVGYSLFGNFFWKMDKDDNITDQSRKYNVFDCGMAWGAGHGDFDLDGHEDLYIANGFASKRPHWSKDHGYSPKREIFVELPQKTADQMFYYEWFIRSLPGAITEDIRNWQPLTILGSMDNQRDCLFMNDQNETFENLTTEFSDVGIWNGKAVVTIDHDNDGRLDLIVSTNNGRIHYLSNQSNSSTSWVGFNLKTKSQNPMSVGSRLRVIQKKHAHHRWVLGGRQGLISQSDNRVHFGLRSSDSVDVEIKWPNGKIQYLSNIKTGKYYDVVEENSPAL